VQLELSGVDEWENLGSEPAADQENNCATGNKVRKHDDTPSFHDEARQPVVLAAQPVKKPLSRLLCVLATRSTQTDTMGTKVLESRYDATIEKPTAKASGTNRLWAAPVMKKAGMNTARMHSIAMKP
jgi:hypothetical protein